jgi:tellurite methyltransferase
MKVLSVLFFFLFVPLLFIGETNEGNERFPILFAQSTRPPISGKKFEHLSGIKNQEDNKYYWDKQFSKDQYIFGKTPASFLAGNLNYLTPGSKVLDMGMGEGRNAVFLARHGFKVVGIDISSVAIKKAKNLAAESGVRIDTVVASLDDYKIAEGSYDVILCFYYVDRKLHQKMISWLKPGGILVYESYTDTHAERHKDKDFERNYLLRPGELISLFPGLKILKYEEPLFNTQEFTASLIALKPGGVPLKDEKVTK